MLLKIGANGAFVYQLGHGPLKAERRVRFPYALPFPESGVCQAFCVPIGLRGWYPSYTMRPFQIIFTPNSAVELAKMPKELQLFILGEFRGVPNDVINRDMEKFGKLERGGKALLRFRLGDYRIYFARHDLGIIVYRILSRNTLKDFLYRSNLPLREDEALQENPKFWELIDAATANHPH